MNQLSLNLEDLLAKPTSKPPALNKLRTTHHEMARLLALGLKDVDISRIMGYSQSRISILKNDPLFKELMEHYSAMRDNIVVDVGSRLSSLSVTALELIQERLIDEPEGLTMKDLQGIAELSLDRSGYGKQQVNVNVNTSAATLAEIKAKIEREHRGRVLPRGQAPEVIDAEFETVVHSEAEAPEGREEDGSGL